MNLPPKEMLARLVSFNTESQRSNLELIHFCRDYLASHGVECTLVPEMLAAPLKRPVHIALSYDEEVGCLGARILARAMTAAGLKPSAVIVGEPSMMQVVTGHKGGTRMKTTVRGHAVHSSRVDVGVPAVMIAGELIAWHNQVMAENRARAKPDNPFEPPYTTLHVGVVQGGTAVNITAENCWFSHEVRVIPGEEDADYVGRYRARIAELEAQMKAIAPGSGIEMEVTSFTPPLGPEVNGEAEALARRLTGDNGSHVVAYGTEGGLFQGEGWSTVVCGPGDIAQAHQPDEFITLAQLDAGVKFARGVIAELSR